MRVDKGRNKWNIPTKKVKACIIVGRGENSLLSDTCSKVTVRLGLHV